MNGDPLKYIVIDDVSPILFGVTLKHSQVAAVAQAMGKNVTGAGFYRMEPVVSVGGTIAYEIKTYGESESLHLSPGPHDAYLIEQMLND